jgi:PAS domain S-box-containing protein
LPTIFHNLKKFSQLMGESEDSLQPITDTQDYRQVLQNYQRRISNILESFTDGFFEVNADWIVTYWNKEAERLLLMPRNEVLGKNLWQSYNSAIDLKFFTEYHRAVENNISVRFEEYFAPREVWVEVAAFPTGSGLSVYFKDITARKNATRELELEKQKYSDLFNLSRLPQWVYDIDSLAFLDVNEAAIYHYGYTREEFMSLTIAHIRPAEDIPSLAEILKSNVTVGVPAKSSVRHRKKNGQVINVFVEGNSVSFAGRNARLVTVIDRTVEIKATQAMEESIARFNVVSKATSDAIWDWNMLTGEMIWNQGIKDIFGYQTTVFDESWWQSRVHPDDLETVVHKISRLVERQKTRLSAEYRFQRADGSYCNVLDRAFILFNKEGKPLRIIGSMQDITERMNHIKAIEEQNTKLREISWIQAHKVRGPLSSILGLTALLREGELLNPEAKELAQHLTVAAEELDLVLREIVNKT